MRRIHVTACLFATGVLLAGLRATQRDGWLGDGNAVVTASGGRGAKLGGTPVDPAQLAETMRSAFAATTSATGTIESKSDKVTESGTFKAAYQDGATRAGSASVSITVQNEPIDLTYLLVDKKLYLQGEKLLAKLKVDKKWLEVSADSSNPQVADLGPEARDDRQTRHFTVLVDPSKAMAAVKLPLPSGAASALPATIPEDMWLDDQNRPVEVSSTVVMQGTSVTSVYKITSFNDPVSITAPDPADVATGWAAGPAPAL